MSPSARPCTKESFGARPPAEIKEMYSTTALRTNAKQKPTSLCYEYLAPLLLPVITAFRQAHELRMERVSATGRGRTGVGLSSIHDGGTIKRNGEKKEGGKGEKRGEAFQNPRFSFHLLLALREGGWDLAASERRKWWRNAKCKERKERVKKKVRRDSRFFFTDHVRAKKEAGIHQCLSRVRRADLRASVVVSQTRTAASIQTSKCRGENGGGGG